MMKFLRDGDLIFVAYRSNDDEPAGPMAAPPVTNHPSSTVPESHSAAVVSRPWQNVQEDPVDDYLRKRDGKMPRSRDSQFCKHGANAMCDYCMPLEVKPFHFSRSDTLADTRPWSAI